jgi:ADP-heptose:LPS heptosyltransferase
MDSRHSPYDFLTDFDIVLPKAHISVLSDHGGMGDQILRIPAIRTCLEQHPHVSLDVYWQDYFVDLAKYLYSHERLTHKKLSVGKANPPAKPVVDFNPERVSPLSLHLTDQAFLILMDRLPKEPREAALLQAPAYHTDKTPNEPYVVITATATAAAREWPAIHVNELARRIRNLGYLPVLLGDTSVIKAGDGVIKGTLSPQIDRSLFHDLVDKTTLFEALGVMQNAECIMGVDNGLLHLAHCTDRPVVMGFTSVEARLRLPTRPKGQTVAIEGETPDYGIQSKFFAVNMDFRSSILPGNPCTLTMRPERFERAFLNLIHD